MKNITGRKKKHKQASEKTGWAYWMQAIEPISDEINRTFPDYHPQFVVQSQRENVSPEMLVYRRLQLGMNARQCAAYLRVNERTLSRWENGHQEIPFMAYELLRVLSENLFAKMSHKAWEGWFISTEGKLVSPNIGKCEYTPEQLEWISWQGTEATRLQREVNHLKKSLVVAQDENTKLRQMFLSQGVVDELYSMHDRLSDLVKQMATAKIVPFQKADQAEPMEKVA